MNNDEWTNKTKLTGQYTNENGHIIELEDTDEYITKSYKKKLEINKLPRTGIESNNKKVIMISVFIIIVSIFRRIEVKKINKMEH